jgi:Outer membrane protein beta-barrel domain
MRGIKPVALMALLCLAAAVVPAAAEAPNWVFRLRGLSSTYDHGFAYSYNNSTSHLQIDNGAGFEVAAEFRPREHFGIEIAAGRLDFDARVWTTQRRPISFDPIVFEEVTIFETSGDFRIEPFSVSALFHPLSNSSWDLYIGPQLAWTRYDVGVEGTQDREAELGYGGKIGLEYSLGRSPWRLGVEYRHLELVHETIDRDLYGDISLDVGSITVGYSLGGAR